MTGNPMHLVIKVLNWLVGNKDIVITKSVQPSVKTLSWMSQREIHKLHSGNRIMDAICILSVNAGFFLMYKLHCVMPQKSCYVVKHSSLLTVHCLFLTSLVVALLLPIWTDVERNSTSRPGFINKILMFTET